VVTAVDAITTSRVSAQTAGLFGINDPFSVQNGLPERFQNYDFSAQTPLAWMCNMATANRIRTNAMAQNSANSIWTDVGGGVPPLLLGSPVYRAGSMANVTTGTAGLIYGDFSRYYIIDRIGFSTEFIPNLFDTSTGRPTATRGWLASWRTGGNVVDANAFRVLRA